MKLQYSKGIALVEIVVGAAIIATSFVAILGIYTALTKLSIQALPKMQAAMVAEEGLEAVRSLRDAGYTSKLGALSSGTPYYLSWSTASSTFYATTTKSLVDNTFSRTMTVANAYRDASYNIASAGTNDANTKLVTITVTWSSGGATSTYALQSYVSNIFNN